MAKQLMLYERAVPVSGERHKDMSVEAGTDFSFAKDVSTAPLLAAEFAAASKEHVIVFAGKTDALIPMVLLGVKGKTNDLVGPDGTWRGDYVPAFLRRYPFVFSKGSGSDNFVLCIDEEFSGANTEGRGERLFDEKGERTEYLTSMLTFSEQYQGQFQRTQGFVKNLQRLKLLEPVKAEVKVNGETTSLSGFQTINREKMRALSAKALKDLAKTDELELCYLHILSLGNLSRLATKQLT